MDETLRELLSDNILQVWKDLECEVRSLYDMDQLWNKRFVHFMPKRMLRIF